MQYAQKTIYNLAAGVKKGRGNTQDIATLRLFCVLKNYLLNLGAWRVMVRVKRSCKVSIPNLGKINNDYFTNMKTTRRQKRRPKLYISGFGCLVLLLLFIKNFGFGFGRVPSESMEPTICKGDFLVQNIHSCGGTTPRTVLQVPFLPSTLFGIRTYLPIFQIPSFRLTPTSTLKQGDIFVFRTYVNKTEAVKNGKTPPPLDQHDNWVKRVGALAEQKIKMENGILYIQDYSGEYVEDPHQVARQYVFDVWLTGKLSEDFLDKYTSISDSGYDKQRETDLTNDYYHYMFTIKHKHLPKYFDELRQHDLQQMQLSEDGDYTVLNLDKNPILSKAEMDDCSTDFKPVTVPYKGMTITLNDETHPLYIKTLKSNLLNFKVIESKDGSKRFILDGADIESYTFTQGYIFPEGDNQYNSDDARYNGFLPEDHVVSRVVCVVWNWQKWRRFFIFPK